MFKYALSILCLIILFACKETRTSVEHTTNIPTPKVTLPKIEDGDLVLRLGNDITSNMLARLNLHDKRFSHIGIAFKEADHIVVYHSIGSENEKDQYIRKDKIEQFFTPTNNLAIGLAKTDFTTSEKDSLHQKLQHWYGQKIPFDMEFDAQDDAKMYCSEMVAKAIMKSNPQYYIPLTDTLSKQYYGIDNIINTKFVDTVYFQQWITNPKQ